MGDVSPGRDGPPTKEEKSVHGGGTVCWRAASIDRGPLVFPGVCKLRGEGGGGGGPEIAG